MRPDLPILLSLPRPRIVNDHVLEGTPPCRWTLWAKRRRNSAGGTRAVPVSQIQRRQQRQKAPFKSTAFPVLAPRTGLDPEKRTLLTPHCPLWFFLSLNLHMICVYKISDRQLNRYIQICLACVYKPFVCSDVHENPFRHIFSDSSQDIDLTSVANASLV